MKLHDYLEETIDFLWRNRKIYTNYKKYVEFLITNTRLHKKEIKELERYVLEDGIYEDECIEFDFPDYGGLPKRLSNRLDGDFVDAIQYTWPPYDYKTKAQFRNDILDGPIDVKRYIRRRLPI